MRGALVIALAACGAKPPPEPQPMAPELRAVTIEWKAVEADAETVAVTIIVDRKAIDLGALPAVTDYDRGPRTCALRAAHPLRTELTCGDMTSYFAAELQGEELAITLVDGNGQREIKRVPVYGTGLHVAPYAMP